MPTITRCLGAAIVTGLLALTPAHAVSPYDKVEKIYQGSETVVGEALVFPQESPEVEALIITMDPGEATQWHQHGTPLFGYILEGELTVTYEGHGERHYKAGDGFLEAMHVTHRGVNTGSTPCRIMAVFMTGKDGELTIPEQAPPQ